MGKAEGLNVTICCGAQLHLSIQRIVMGC